MTRTWSYRTTCLILGLALILAGSPGHAQEPPVPAPETPPPAPVGVSIEERLQRLEEMNRQLMEENQQLRAQFRDIDERLEAARERPDTTTEGGAGARDNPAGAATEAPGEAAPLPESRDTSDEGGAGARDNPSEDSYEILRKGKKLPLNLNFGPGFELQTEDEEFQLQFHNETQVEARIFEQQNQSFAHPGFYIPRQRWFFTGHLTKPIEYYTSFNKGLGGVNLLDAFVNFHYDDRFMVKFGRYKVPYTYEFYAISNVDLIAPERSLYAANFGNNREYGLMGWGRLFDKRLDYAVGIFNGGRNTFEELNDAKDVIAYLNGRPFEGVEGLEFLHNFNIGGSVSAGNQDNPLQSQALRTSLNASNSTGAAAASPAFLIFNNNVIENGPRELWNLHLAYFYEGLSLLAAWDSGIESYRQINQPNRVQVPVDGYFVQAAYFLTGETVSRRTQVIPLHPFDLRRERFGLGAWEIHARYSALNLGNEVFRGGLADPNLWSSNLYAIDMGLNWYLNPYTKIYLDWQHAVFGNPVFYAPGKFQKTSDLFWIRCQIYF